MFVCKSSLWDVVSYTRYTAYDIAILDYMRENAKEKEHEQERENDKNGVTL